MSSAAIDINLIRADDRIRKVTPAAVAALAESIVEVGLLNPITITRVKSSAMDSRFRATA